MMSFERDKAPLQMLGLAGDSGVVTFIVWLITDELC